LPRVTGRHRPGWASERGHHEDDNIFAAGKNCSTHRPFLPPTAQQHRYLSLYSRRRPFFRLTGGQFLPGAKMFRIGRPLPALAFPQQATVVWWTGIRGLIGIF
jgi:hypothetical protein